MCSVAINQSELVAFGLNDHKVVCYLNSLPFRFRRSLDFGCSVFRHSLYSAFFRLLRLVRQSLNITKKSIFSGVQLFSLTTLVLMWSLAFFLSWLTSWSEVQTFYFAQTTNLSSMTSRTGNSQLFYKELPNLIHVSTWKQWSFTKIRVFKGLLPLRSGSLPFIGE